MMISICAEEVEFESNKFRLNESRKEERICATRYPILLVHGVFFRDFKLRNYWGRIPAELERNGATVFYGEHQSAASVDESAAELTRRIREIIETTGCEKVNIIAHSKGGLDTRCALTRYGIAPYVASVTTINTPHRGCGFADDLLKKVPDPVQKKVEETYNTLAKKLGDTEPDFMSAVRDLTAERCREFNREFTVPDGIFCQSVGSLQKKATSGRFPLNLSHPIVARSDGPNDGLVALDSFEWGEKFTYLAPRHNRGISHGDVVDFNRENVRDFDVREFYVQLVSDLRERGF